MEGSRGDSLLKSGGRIAVPDSVTASAIRVNSDVTEPFDPVFYDFAPVGKVIKHRI